MRGAQKRDFRSGSISEFFNSIDVKRPLRIAAVDVAVGRAADPLTHLRSVTSTLAI
jgi:hypothetical protein